jgi:ABC-2 type transport system permease protein
VNRLHLDAATAILKRDVVVFLSYRVQFFTTVLSSFFTITIFHYVSQLVNVPTFGSPDDYYAFVVVGLVVLQVLQSTMNVAMTVRGELVAGTLERILMSPFGVVRGIAAMLIFPFIMAMLTATATLFLASTVYGLPVKWGTAWLAVPVGFLGAVCFAAFGLFFAALVLMFKQTLMGTSFVIAIISLVAGFYFPVALLPDWIEWASDAQPFTPAVDLMRHLLVGTPLTDEALTEVTRLAVFALAMMPPAFVLLQKSVNIGRARGTIMEY